MIHLKCVTLLCALLLDGMRLLAADLSSDAQTLGWEDFFHTR